MFKIDKEEMVSFRCTSSVRDRMVMVAQHYCELIRDGQIAVPEGRTSEEHAMIIMKEAFMKPPVYHYPPSILVPAHCLGMDILNAAELLAAITGGTSVRYLQQRCATWNQLAFAFLDHINAAEIDHLGCLSEADSLLRRLSREETSAEAGKAIVAASTSLQDAISSGTVVLFLSWPVRNSVLIARSIAVILISVVLCSSDDRITVLRNLADALRLPDVTDRLVCLLATLPPLLMESLVADFQMYLTVETMTSGITQHMMSVCSTLKILFEANFHSEAHRRDGIVHFTKFYNGLTEDFGDADIRDDVVRLLDNQFSFASFPFLVSARYKSIVLQLEASVERDGALHEAIISNLFTNRGASVLDDFFLVLNIHRNDLVNSAVRELRTKRNYLRRPLRVHFVGEDGVDEGGLKKEFFQMLLRELLHPNYNMFMNPENSPALWLVPRIQNSVNDTEYRLIGQCIGIAVYNNITLDLAFPTAIFRKLLNVPVTCDDLADVDPQLKQGLDTLLAFDESMGTVEDIFCRTFVFEHRVFDETVVVPLVPGGNEINLKAENRVAFVNAMANYVLNASIEENFEAFREGFFSVCTRKMVSSLRPEELESIVCGDRSFDLEALRKSSMYEGFTEEDDTVRFLWEVLHELDDPGRRRFLKFCTGSDRIPVGGVVDLHFCVGKNGDDSELLPTSHTCFNHLLLPAYATKEKLRIKLMLAVENCEGFFGGQ